MTSVYEYLEQAPEPQRSTLIELRRTLREILPEATEELSYSVPAFKIGGKAVAGYAFARNHCSYFPHSGQVLERLGQDELEGYEWSKGTLRFPVDKPLPPALLRRLVEERRSQLGI